MKSICIVLALFLLGSFCNAQTHYSCETSRIGKIITTPLRKNGSISYELARIDSGITDKDAMKEIMNKAVDNCRVIYSYNHDIVVMRDHFFNKDSLVELMFIYSTHSYQAQCSYQIAV